MSEEDPSSELGMSIAKLFPVLLEKTSFVIPDRKVQGVFGYLAKVLCAEDESSDIYADALICVNEVIPFPPLLSSSSPPLFANKLLFPSRMPLQTLPPKHTLPFARRPPNPFLILPMLLSAGAWLHLPPELSGAP